MSSNEAPSDVGQPSNFRAVRDRLQSSDIDWAASPNDVIREIYSSGTVRDAWHGQRRALLKSAISFDEGMALYDWVRKARATDTLEVGMGYGLSTLFICQAHHDVGAEGQHTAIDPMQGSTFDSIGLLNIRRAALESRLEFHEAPSHQVLPRLREQRRRFDLIFIDGMHTFDYVMVDFFYADLLLRVGGHVVIDDIWMPSVRKAAIYILRNRAYCLEPGIFRNAGSFWERGLSFLSREGRKQKVAANLRQFAQYPFDVLTFLYMGYLGLNGGLKFWALRKVAEDDRPWHFHTAF